MAHQDVITFKPERIKIISDRKINEILYDPNHLPIIKALRKGPMTVREIETAYANEAEESQDVEAKSDKTIYRYLKVLEKADLVVPAGQRVVIGKTATETLFSRSAEIFITRQTEDDYWSCEAGQELANKMARMLSRLYDDRKADEACIVKFMNKFDYEGNRYIVGLVEEADKELVDLISSIDWAYKDKVLNYVAMLAIILKNPQLLDELRACFK